MGGVLMLTKASPTDPQGTFDAPLGILAPFLSRRGSNSTSSLHRFAISKKLSSCYPGTPIRNMHSPMNAIGS